MRTWIPVLMAVTIVAGFKDPTSGTAHILSIAHDVISLQPSTKGHKPNYLIKLQVAKTETIVLYQVGQSQDYMSSFKEGTDVSYRADGKNVFLTAPDGRKIKTTQCTVNGDATLCGEDIFPNTK
jgi:hypothetical protein